VREREGMGGERREGIGEDRIGEEGWGRGYR